MSGAETSPLDDLREEVERLRTALAENEAAAAEKEDQLQRYAADLRGRRLGRAVLVFTTGEEHAGIVVTLGADPIPVEEAAAAVLQVLSETAAG